MPPQMSPQESEFVDRVGLFIEMLGSTRTSGRVYGWLMICEAAHQSITELAAVLQVSKASISTVIRQLELGQMVERVPVSGSRQHHYRLLPGGWAQILRARVARLKPGVEAAEFGLSIVSDDRPQQRERLHELRDFLSFVQQEYGETHARRWEAFRDQARRQRSKTRS